jgi:hypothetical protein
VTEHSCQIKYGPCDIVVTLTGMVELMRRFGHPFATSILLAISCSVVEV